MKSSYLEVTNKFLFSIGKTSISRTNKSFNRKITPFVSLLTLSHQFPRTPTSTYYHTSLYPLATSIMGGGSIFPLHPTMAKKAMDEAEVDEVLKGKYPAKKHAKNVVDWIKAKGELSSLGGVIYLEGQKTRMQEDNDEAVPFRQVSCLIPSIYSPRAIPKNLGDINSSMSKIKTTEILISQNREDTSTT